VETPAAPASAPVESPAERDGVAGSSSTVGGAGGGAVADTASSSAAAPEEAAPADATDKSRPRRRAKAVAERKDRGPADGDDSRSAPVLSLREGESSARPAAPAASPAGEATEEQSKSTAGQALPPSSAPAGPAPTAPAPTTAAKQPDAAEKPAPSSPADLHKQALAAASSSRCLEVQQLGQSVRRLDPGYYDKVFRPDRRLAVCLSAGKATKTRGK
jgi:hypothetical protein